MCRVLVGPLCGIDRDGVWVWAVVSECSRGTRLRLHQREQGNAGIHMGKPAFQREWQLKRIPTERRERVVALKHHVGDISAHDDTDELVLELRCADPLEGEAIGRVDVRRVLRGFRRGTVSGAVIVCSDIDNGVVRPRMCRMGGYQWLLHLGDLVYGVEEITSEDLLLKYLTTWRWGIGEWARGVPVAQQLDDHELSNNYWMGMWGEKVKRRVEMWEWMTPTRVGAGGDLKPYGGGRFYAFSMPNAGWRVVMIDSRTQRERQPGKGQMPFELFDSRELSAPRRLLGERQWVWLENEIEEARRAGEWVLLVQQVVIGPIVYARRGCRRDGRLGVNGDQWDGYQAERQRLLEMLARMEGRAVCVSGDWHVGLLGTLMIGKEVVAGEVAVPALGSGCWWWEDVARAVARSDVWEWIGPNRRGACTIHLCERGCEVEMIWAGHRGPRWRWVGSGWRMVGGSRDRPHTLTKTVGWGGATSRDQELGG